MYLKEMLAIKALIMKTLESAVDEMLEQYQFNQLNYAEKIKIDLDKDSPSNPNYLRPDNFEAKLFFNFKKDNQMEFSQIACQPSFTIPDYDELMVNMK